MFPRQGDLGARSWFCLFIAWRCFLLSGQHTKMANQILIATNMIGVVEGEDHAESESREVHNHRKDTRFLHTSHVHVYTYVHVCVSTGLRIYLRVFVAAPCVCRYACHL